jgi:3-mercaptopyruvate sulfurtransferase SseA
VALKLKRNGISRVRPLQGGLNLWMARKFPIEELQITRAPSPVLLAQARDQLPGGMAQT